MGDTPDFSGYATKAGLVCSDGRTILPDAFRHQDGARVPLMWQHKHGESENVLGYGVLEHRDDGTYVYGYFNDTEAGQRAKKLVQHGDIKALSIFANRLKQRGAEVMHGFIGEVSLVLAGANPGAFIDDVAMAHADGDDFVGGEALIYTGLSLEHADQTPKEADMAEDNKTTNEAEETVADVLETFNEKQRKVLEYIVGEAVASDDADDADDADDVEHSITTEEFLTHIDNRIQEGITAMTANVFESNGAAVSSDRKHLTHSQIETILRDGQRMGSFKESVLAHADEYGIQDIEFLFPDAQAVTDKPELLARQVEWVREVLAATKHTPFAKVKSIVADLTADEARAKGYVKGSLKKEEIIRLLRRTTSPTTVYKKQKLDRDDIIDITDFDVVNWLKWEIRFMLEEELARAILIGDGRSALSDDKIKDPQDAVDGEGIRSIANDHDMYAHKVNLPANISAEAQIEEITRARSAYRGTGNPTLFTTDKNLIDLLLLKDKMGRRLYATEAELAAALRVSKITTVEVLEEQPEILAIIVNLSDYNIGTNKGGELTSFEDFDIDYNQMKYLLETRLSGALTKPKSAIVVKRAQGTPVVPGAPSFNGETNTITIPTTTGVIYQIDGEPVTGDVVISETTDVDAKADEDYYIQAGSTTSWTFVYTSGE